MHGGTSKGAPKGNRNAWKHGNRSAEAEEQLKIVRQTDRDLKLLNKVQQHLDLGTKEKDRFLRMLTKQGLNFDPRKDDLAG